jgi:hypothetical protein
MRGEASAAARKRYVDELVDHYVSWREACAAVASAHADWKRAGRHEHKLAHSDYVAALDHEEDAATVYQRAVEQFAALPPGRSGDRVHAGLASPSFDG